MLKKRIVLSLTFLDGVLFRTKNFKPDYMYTKNFVDMWSVDEILIIDISKNKFSKSFFEIIKFFSSKCFVPLTIGGGIKKLSDADDFFKSGADKILLGTHAIENSKVINEISKKYGNQSIIQSIDCKRSNEKNQWNVMTNSGRINIQEEPIQLAKKMIKMGAGEILINSIDNDGGLLGYDLDLIKMFSENINCPILALGGAGNWNHILELFQQTDISAACTQNIFHFTEDSILSVKNFLKAQDIKIRK